MTTERGHGLHHAVPEAEYHADPALSQSKAKTLLGSPARYKWQVDNPPVVSETQQRAFDMGTAVHTKVLGAGTPVVAVEADSWRTNAAKDAEKEARANGCVPLLKHQMGELNNIAKAVFKHPRAREILARPGEVEVSGWWTDYDRDGVPVEGRGRFDKITTTVDGYPVVVDLKTTGKSAGPTEFAKSVVTYDYDLQGAWYSNGYEILTEEKAGFVFIVVEKDPPYLVAVHTLDDLFMERGHQARLDALDLYTTCTINDEWPGHGDDIHVLTPPRWAY